MELYEHGGDIYGNPNIRIDFSVNTNPLGLPELVKNALVSRMDELANYPDPKCRELCEAISCYEEIQQDWILCGNGAADLIYRLSYALRPKKALVLAPTFSEYERALSQTGCDVIIHELKEETGFVLTTDILEQVKFGIDVLFLCQPNNPTGRLIQPNLMEQIIKKANESDTLVVIDECFLDFTGGESAKKYLQSKQNLVVLKAFTKMYAMAGLRLGYLLTSNKALKSQIDSAAQYWSVSVPAQIAGVSALSCKNWIEITKQQMVEERLFLDAELSKLGITVFPSDANFLLLCFEEPLFERLKEKGILVRSCQNFQGLDNRYFRIGIKTRDENLQLVQAIRELCMISGIAAKVET